MVRLVIWDAIALFMTSLYCQFYPHPTGLLHWHWSNLVTPMPSAYGATLRNMGKHGKITKNLKLTTARQITTQPCAYFMKHIVHLFSNLLISSYVRWVSAGRGRRRRVVYEPGRIVPHCGLMIRTSANGDDEKMFPLWCAHINQIAGTQKHWR